MTANREKFSALFGVGVVVVWLVFWELCARVVNPYFFTPPSDIVVLLCRVLFVTGELRPHVWATVKRLLGGFLVGSLPALWLGFIIGRSKLAYLRYGPFFAFFGLIPIISAFPVFIILFGVGDLGKSAMVAAAVFYPILYCTARGVRMPASTTMREAARPTR
jgi:NitT/TauT family transport system permease protein